MRSALFFLLAAIFANSLSAQKPAALLKSADSLFDREQFAAATDGYEAVLRLQPGNELALRGLGAAAVKQRQPAAAEARYRQALKSNPACGRCLVGLAQVRALQHDTAGMLAYHDSAVIAQPANGWMLAYRGAARIMAGKETTGQADMERSLELSPEMYEVQAFYAEYLYNRHYPALATERLVTAIRLAPPSKKAVYLLLRARWLFEDSKYEETISDADSGLRYLPGEPRLQKLKGMAHYGLKELQPALAYLSLAIAKLPPDNEAFYTRAIVRHALEDMDGSCRDLHAALAATDRADKEDRRAIQNVMKGYCDSSKAAYYYQRGIAMYNLNNYRAAIGWHQRGLQRFPGHHMMQSFLANSYYSARSMDSAVLFYKAAMTSRADYERALVADGFDQAITQEQYLTFAAELYLHLAEIGLQTNNTAEGMKNAAAGLGLLKGTYSPVKTSLYRVRGALYVEMNQPDSAIQDFSDCIAIKPDDGFYYFGRIAARLEKAAGKKVTVLWQRPEVQGLSGMPLWLPTDEAFENRPGADFGTALEDCNTLLRTDPDFGCASLLKAAVLAGMGQAYCGELNAAEKSGLRVPAVWKHGCGK